MLELQDTAENSVLGVRLILILSACVLWLNLSGSVDVGGNLQCTTSTPIARFYDVSFFFPPEI